MTPSELVRQRAADNDVPTDVLRGPGKTRLLFNIRTLIARELRGEPWKLSLPEIGRALGRNHTSILSALRGGKGRQCP